MTDQYEITEEEKIENKQQQWYFQVRIEKNYQEREMRAQSSVLS